MIAVSSSSNKAAEQRWVNVSLTFDRSYAVDSRKAVVRTLDEAGHMFGLSGRQIQNWIAQGCPGEKGRYVVAEMFEWARTQGPYRQFSGEDAELEGGDSEWLERYREEKTLLARLERKQKEQQLVRVEDLIDPLMEGAAVVRSAGERIGRDYGPEAQAIVNEAVQEFIDSLRRIRGDE